MAEPRRFSEHTAQVIDEEVTRLLSDASDKATTILTENRDKLDALAKKLEDVETLDEADVEKVIGPPLYRKPDTTDGSPVSAGEKGEGGPRQVIH